MTDTTVRVDIVDHNGTVEASFTPKPGQSFVDAADEIGYEMSVSCCAGACYTCACRIVQGQEDVDTSLVSEPLIDIEEEQVLTCIGGLRDEVFRDGKFHHIILQKLN